MDVPKSSTNIVLVTILITLIAIISVLTGCYAFLRHSIPKDSKSLAERNSVTGNNYQTAQSDKTLARHIRDRAGDSYAIQRIQDS